VLVCSVAQLLYSSCALLAAGGERESARARALVLIDLVRCYSGALSC
jgi:hypothetical protein